MTTETRPVVLITGCSSGIGLASARRFAAANFRVYASMRRPEAGTALRDEAAAAGWALATPALDVTSDQSVSDAVAGILAETGNRIDVLVNNAGYFLSGPIEETSPDELRAQLETNLIGVLRVTRAVLPVLRARGGGAIVNLSSISGRVVVPGVGPYHASKWALEALTEALRYEVYPFGIRVVAVEPGTFETPFYAKELRVAEARRPDSPYAPMLREYERQAARMRKGDVERVADVVFRAATSARPPLRWRVGPTSFSGGVLRRFVPDGLYEWLIRLVFRLRRRPASSVTGHGPPGPV